MKQSPKKMRELSRAYFRGLFGSQKITLVSLVGNKKGPFSVAQPFLRVGRQKYSRTYSLFFAVVDYPVIYVSLKNQGLLRLCTLCTGLHRYPIYDVRPKLNLPDLPRTSTMASSGRNGAILTLQMEFVPVPRVRIVRAHSYAQADIIFDGSDRVSGPPRRSFITAVDTSRRCRREQAGCQEQKMDENMQRRPSFIYLIVWKAQT